MLAGLCKRCQEYFLWKKVAFEETERDRLSLSSADAMSERLEMVTTAR